MKIVVITRGIPGSGKSTFVDFIKKTVDHYAIHAVDDLHLDEDGNFFWDENKASSRYLLNYANFVKSCSENIPLVVCDCINLTRESVEKYVIAAREFGYIPYVVTPDQPSVLEASVRNTHQVSLPQLKDMSGKWESWP